MPSFQTSRTVRHSADEMFDLVADVESYPQFLPYCEKLVVRSRGPAEDGRELLVADMTVGYKFVRETYTSRVLLDRRRRRIDVTAIDGPFRSLANVWRFVEQDPGSGNPSRAAAGTEALGKGSEVNFQISWEFKSKLLGNLVGSLFDRAFRKYAEAFETRADAVYGMA